MLLWQGISVGRLIFDLTAPDLEMAEHNMTETALSAQIGKAYYFCNPIPSLDAHMAVLAALSLLLPLPLEESIDVEAFRVNFPGWPRVGLGFVKPYNRVAVENAVLVIWTLGMGCIAWGTETGVRFWNGTTGETTVDGQLRRVSEGGLSGDAGGVGGVAAIS